MEKSRLIIIEGPQGTGKTTLANYLRETIPGSNLYRLSGQRDKTVLGKQYSLDMYNALLDYLKVMQNIPMDIIFDRTFFTEEVYARLGYKEYQFTDVYNELLNRLASLNYKIFYLNLYLKNLELFRERIDRKEHHLYQPFSLESCEKQQSTYNKVFEEMLENKAIISNPYFHPISIPVDEFDEAYKIVRKILEIKK